MSYPHRVPGSLINNSVSDDWMNEWEPMTWELIKSLHGINDVSQISSPADGESKNAFVRSVKWGEEVLRREAEVRELVRSHQHRVDSSKGVVTTERGEEGTLEQTTVNSCIQETKWVTFTDYYALVLTTTLQGIYILTCIF